MDYEKEYKDALERAKAGKPMNEVFPELKESEDERIRKELVNFIKKNSATPFALYDRFTPKQYIAYLERQKEQHPAEWSEEDKKKLNGITNCLCSTSGDIDGFDEWYDWLEDLPNRFALQPKQEWSEEDEALIENVCTALKGYALHERKVDLDEHAHRLEEMSERLKSLRPQPHWKPSEWQMEALEDVICLGPERNCIKILKSLYNDLKKLL